MQQKTSLAYFIYAIFIISVLFTAEIFLKDPDVFWHLAAGKWILENQSIPSLNIFSFTAGDYHWLNISWLWDLIFGTLEKYGGIHLALATNVVITAITIFIVTNQSYQKSGSVIATVITILLGATVLFPTLSLRPHMASYILIPIFIHILNRLEAKEINFKKILITLAAIMCVWANMHGAFLVAFTILFVYSIQSLAEKNFEVFKQYIFISIVCVLATLINPLGIGLYEAVYRTLGGELQNYITEWQQSSQLHYLRYTGFFLISLLFILNKLKLREIILSILWLALAFQSARYGAVLFLITAPFFAYSLKDLFAKKNSDYIKDLASEKALKLGQNVAVISTVVILLIEGITIQKDPAIMLLQDKYSESNILNHYNYGGHMIYQGNLKTFIDGRAETAFPDSLISDYINFDTKSDLSVLHKYNIDIVFYPQSPLTKELSNNGWDVIYEDAERVILSSPNVDKDE